MRFSPFLVTFITFLSKNRKKWRFCLEDCFLFTYICNRNVNSKQTTGNRQRTTEGETPPTPLFRGEKLGLMLKYRPLTPERSDNSSNSFNSPLK